MTDTNDLIARLAAEAKNTKPPLKPGRSILLLLAVLLAYAIGAQMYLGLRPDLIHLLADGWFEAEITALWLMVVTSAWGAALLMAPDAYQKTLPLKYPYLAFAALILIVGYQMVMQGMVEPGPVFLKQFIDTQGMECSICIALLSIVPSALIFAILKRGNSVQPLRAGSFAVLSTTGIGCLTLRLAEANNSIMHFAEWHYLPTLLFAILGAWLGKWILRW